LSSTAATYPSHDDGTDAHVDDTPRATRLAAGAADLAAQCPCEGPSRIHVLRGFSRRSRAVAREVRTRLSRHQGLLVRDEAVPVVATDFAPVDGHVCSFVSVDTPSSEGERIAALNGRPIVVSRGDVSDPRHPFIDELIPMLVADGGADPSATAVTFPSASGRVTNAAFDAFDVEPNQPETGELILSLPSGPRHFLSPGSRVRLRPLPETCVVEVSDHTGTVSVWFGDRVAIRQRAGLHRIFRDGCSVADLPVAITVQHHPEALFRRHV
jgi:hypothetical protein